MAFSKKNANGIYVNFLPLNKLILVPILNEKSLKNYDKKQRKS